MFSRTPRRGHPETLDETHEFGKFRLRTPRGVAGDQAFRCTTEPQCPELGTLPPLGNTSQLPGRRAQNLPVTQTHLLPGPAARRTGAAKWALEGPLTCPCSPHGVTLGAPSIPVAQASPGPAAVLTRPDTPSWEGCQSPGPAGLEAHPRESRPAVHQRTLRA